MLRVGLLSLPLFPLFIIVFFFLFLRHNLRLPCHLDPLLLLVRQLLLLQRRLRRRLGVLPHLVGVLRLVILLTARLLPLNALGLCVFGLLAALGLCVLGLLVALGLIRIELDLKIGLILDGFLDILVAKSVCDLYAS